MATIKQGILGGFSGKIGGVVGSSWKGIAVIKAKPLSVANPKTAPQLAQRAKLAATVVDLQQILASVIKPLNDRFSGQMSGYNYALQECIHAYDEDGVMESPDKFRISRSSAKAQLIDAIAAEANLMNVRVSWTSDAGLGKALANDKMYVVVRERRTNIMGVSAGTVVRGDDYAIVNMPAGYIPTNNNGVDVYLAALRADGSVGFAQDWKNGL